jgi:uncharacterized protein
MALDQGSIISSATPPLQNWGGYNPAITGWAYNNLASGFAEGTIFLGYSTLAVMAQRAEYMNMSTSLADDETRKWIKFKARAESMDKSEKIKAIEDKLDSLKAQAAFKTYLTQAYHYGRAHLYLDTGDTDNPDELKTDLGGGARSAASALKMAGKKLIGLRPIEAVWCTPHDYETSDPLKPNWYEPQAWFAMSKQIHASRLLKIIPHPVSDLLKPAYSFGGVPLIQMAKPYVENWLKARQSVSDLIQSFSQWVLKTNLDATLAGGTGDDVYARAAIFNNAKNSRGLMIVDKDKEDFGNVNTPLGGLDELQAQALEHICSAIRQPVVKYTGIDPQGLNASSEGSIRVYYDLIHSTQEYLIRPPLQIVVDLVQIELFGDVDPDILLEFEPLYEMTDIEKAQVRYQDAQTGALLIQSQVIDPQEERARVADDPDTPYVDLDPMAMPEVPQPDQHTDAWTKVFGQLAKTGIGPEEPGPSGGWAPALKRLSRTGVAPNDEPDNSGWAPVFGGLHTSGGMQPQAAQTPIARGRAVAGAEGGLTGISINCRDGSKNTPHPEACASRTTRRRRVTIAKPSRTLSCAISLFPLFQLATSPHPKRNKAKIRFLKSPHKQSVAS